MAPIIAPDSTPALIPPNWPSISDEITCPLCFYNLRGLEKPICPECGLTFEWPDVLDPTRWKHPYLFEHHPERKAWSFVKTLRASLRPGKFWRMLRPHQRGTARRLILYWLLAQATALLVLIPVIMAESLNVKETSLRIRATPAFSQRARNWTPRQLEMVAPLESSPWYYLEVGRQVARRWLWPTKRSAFFFIFAAWPWMTFAALMVFRDSMHRARLQAVQVLRCALYSADIVAWFYPFIALALIAQLALASTITLGRPVHPLFAWISTSIMAATTLIALALPCRLWIAYRLYLRFDRPFWTVLASQVIVLIAMLVCADRLDIIK